MAIYSTLASRDILSTNLKLTIHTNTDDVYVQSVRGSELPTVRVLQDYGVLQFFG
jgi:hypothetical protein